MHCPRDEEYGHISEVFHDERNARFVCRCPGFFSLTGTVYSAPTVTYFGVTWDMDIYPSDVEGCVKVFMSRDLGEVVPEPIRFTIGVEKADGGEEVILRDQKFHEKCKMWGFRILPRFRLLSLRQQLPVTGDLTITCTIRKEESLHTENPEPIISESKEEEQGIDSDRRKRSLPTDSEDAFILTEHLKDLLHSGDDHDVVIKVKNEQFEAHRCILRARSPVFAAMFRSNMEETASGTITIDDCDPDAFKEFLQYVYTGKVDIPSANVALGLYYAGDKYDFPRLKKRCVEFLKFSLSLTTISDVITVAARHGEKELLQMAIYYFSKNLEDIIVTVEWQRFLTSNPIQANEMYLKAVQSLKASKDK